jgi:hypothetical protein
MMEWINYQSSQRIMMTYHEISIIHFVCQFLYTHFNSSLNTQWRSLHRFEYVILIIVLKYIFIYLTFYTGYSN